jgi:hypothetical protein
MRTSIAMLLPVLAACGGGTDAGSGTGTLFATIEVTGRPNDTKVELELSARGNPVIGANVVLTDVDRELPVTAEAKNAGRYDANFMGYARTIEVKIVAGEDELEASLEGPAPHVITRPPNDAIVRRADYEVLTVEWEADDPADSVEVAPEDGDKVNLEEDDFETDIPLGPLKNGSQKISVERATSVDLSGGTAGSRFRSRYKVDNRFTLEG